jgi:hypothetical protein
MMPYERLRSFDDVTGKKFRTTCALLSMRKWWTRGFRRQAESQSGNDVTIHFDDPNLQMALFFASYSLTCCTLFDDVTQYSNYGGPEVPSLLVICGLL